MHKFIFLSLAILGLASTALASSPMEVEIMRGLGQIRSVGEEQWSQRIEEERQRKEEQEANVRATERKVVYRPVKSLGN